MRPSHGSPRGCANGWWRPVARRPPRGSRQRCRPSRAVPCSARRPSRGWSAGSPTTWSAPGRSRRLLADQDVTDVLVNGGEVWVDRGAGLDRADVALGGPDDVRRLAQRLAAACGRRLDDGCPCVDAPLPDGTRLHAVLPPVADAGPYLSLRTFRQRAFTLDELVAAGTVPPAVRRAAGRDRRGPAGVPGHRRHRHRQDHAAHTLLVAGAADRADRARRGRRRAAARASARGRPCRPARPMWRAPAA